MRVRLEPYREYARAEWKTQALFVLGAFAILGGLVGFAFSALVTFVDAADWTEKLATGAAVAAVVGVIPVVVGAVLLWRGLLRRRRFARVRDLVGLAQSGGVVSVGELTRVLGMSALDAQRLVLDATAMGVVELTEASTAGPAEPFAATVVASSNGPLPRGNDPKQLVGAMLNGTYQVEQFVGAGGMGAVYAARHVRTGRRYALKTLLADERLDPDALKRFEREATAASALGHPGIIAVHDFNRDEGGTRYLVMDLLEGETLEQRLRRLGSLPWAAAQRIALEIGSALVVAHGAGLLHRDLKPANIFLARSTGADGERAVLLDFGLVKPLDPNAATLTASGAALGTPLYMAPEQARGEECDVRTDIHGLAMVIFEMVAGVTPYHDKTLPNVIARLLTTLAPAPSAVARTPVPPGLDATLGCALSKSREGRYPAMSAFVEALRRLG